MDREKETEIHLERSETEETDHEAGLQADIAGEPTDAQATSAPQDTAEAEAPPLNLVEELKRELEEANRKAEENLDGWQRSLADFSNYKKRVERDQSLTYQHAAGKIIRKYLEISDDLERALNNRPADGEGATWAKGIELIATKLQGFLQSEGVELIEAVGQPFDPNLHEAISQEENDAFESGQIIAVVQNGYLLGERVLRPAIVRVAK